MSVNSSSSADLSLLPPLFSSSNSSLHPPINSCFRTKASIFAFSAFFITSLLLFLPLFIFVLYLGYQQWRKQRFVSTAADLFLYHSIAMELNSFLGFSFFFCGGFFNLQVMMSAGLCLWSITSLGQALFHILTCVERYLAVVHPITYRGLRQGGGARIRNISTGCVWLLCSGWMTVLNLTGPEFTMVLYLCIMVSLLVVMSFCSISVLRALKRPGPGEVGGNRERADQSKQRAFHTIVAIMGVLLFRFGGNLIGNLLFSSSALEPSDLCVVRLSAFWLDLPSSLVLPLLFLHRAGKLRCCKRSGAEELG
ncbi:uncharacterized protein LOC121177444 [Toxotes jaculatrix]|uniref:uncharacterized protein LOC121177444 n=1 Tax=Toxotes jaculatrix TaxID=941984 RepID=UPI001B3B0BF3|nr:uncharacterized protein LOC121177444 [Toxotes jaculatrix]